MSQVNFFEPFLQVHERKKVKVPWAFVVLVVVLVGVAATHFFMQMKYFAMEKELNEIEDYITSQETVSKVESVQMKMEKVAELDSLLASIDILQYKTETMYKSEYGFIETANVNRTKGLFLHSYNAGPEEIKINGYSNSYEQIAYYIYNLKRSGKFVEVTSPMISEIEGGYSFSINCTLEPEVPYEDK